MLKKKGRRQQKQQTNQKTLKSWKAWLSVTSSSILFELGRWGECKKSQNKHSLLGSKGPSRSCLSRRIQLFFMYCERPKVEFFSTYRWLNQISLTSWPKKILTSTSRHPSHSKSSFISEGKVIVPIFPRLEKTPYIFSCSQKARTVWCRRAWTAAGVKSALSPSVML